MENNEKNINEVESNSLPTENEQAQTPVAEASKKKFPLWIAAVAAVVICAIIVAVALLIPGEPTSGDYTVEVVDEIGNPVNGVLIRLTDESGATKLALSEGGVAMFNEVSYNNVSIEADKAALKVQILHTTFKSKSSAKVIVRNPDKTQDIYGDVDDDAVAYGVGAGSYTIPAIANAPTYLVFMASTTGVYKISIECDYDGATVGYYGIPMFVQSSHKASGEYDGRSFDLVIQDTNTPNVIGIKSDKDCDVNLTISREGDAPFDPHYLPWDEVLASENFIDFSTGDLVPVDISAASINLTLGADGYYYIGSKRVYIRITTSSEYLDASLSMIAGFENDNIGQNVGGYVYDGDGNFVAKYSYNTMIGQYMEHCDSNGVYPLTAELVSAIKLHGESSGWWKPGTPNFLFEGKPYNPDYAWMFLCCVEQ